MIKILNTDGKDLGIQVPADTYQGLTAICTKMLWVFDTVYPELTRVHWAYQEGFASQKVYMSYNQVFTHKYRYDKKPLINKRGRIFLAMCGPKLVDFTKAIGQLGIRPGSLTFDMAARRVVFLDDAHTIEVNLAKPFTPPPPFN